MTGVLAGDPVAGVAVFALFVLRLPVPVLGLYGQRVEVEHLGDEAVQDGGEQQRHHEEDPEVHEVDGHVQVPLHPVPADDEGDVGVDHLLDVRQIEPHGAVQTGQGPEEGDDLFGSGIGAQRLGFNRIADGDVSLHGERRDGGGGGVDAQILEVGDARATVAAVHPVSEDAARDGGRAGSREHHQVGHSQAYDVAVGRSLHVFGGEHHQDHHHVANDSQDANGDDEECADNFVFGAGARPGRQSGVHNRSVGEVLHLCLSRRNQWKGEGKKKK